MLEQIDGEQQKLFAVLRKMVNMFCDEVKRKHPDKFVDVEIANGTAAKIIERYKIQHYNNLYCSNKLIEFPTYSQMMDK